MATVIKDLGAVTAYAYAVEGGYTGTEEEFAALLGNIADDLSQIENLSVTVTTLPAGSSATASYSNGVLALGIPKGDKGDKGDTGATPAFTIGTVTTLAAGNDASASITGTAAAPVLNLGIPKGADGDVSSASMATAYSTSATYAVGDYVWYSGQLYCCTTAISTAESWTAAHWTAVKLAEDVGNLKSALELVDIPNWITSSNFRADSYQSVLLVDSVNRTMVVDGYQSSANTELFRFMRREAPYLLPLEADKRYFAFARVAFGSSQTAPMAARVRLQLTKDGDLSVNTYIGDGVVVSQNIGNTAYLYGEITPDAAKNGYLRAVFDGMGTGGNTYSFTIDKVFFAEIAESAKIYAIYNELVGLDNPIDELIFSNAISGNGFDVDLLCWGDSLTAGAGGSGVTYPMICANELGITSLNCGVGGENCQTIAARQGGNNIVIPAGAVNGTYQTLSDIFGNGLAPLLQGNGKGSGNKLIIEGQECSLSYASGTGYTISGYTGDALSVPTLARFAGSDFTGKIVTIWIGTNGGAFPGYTAGIDMRIAWINSMIKHIGHDRYVILGLTVGEETASFYINEENRMKQAFGNKYFPTRKYLIESGLTIAGITPTSQDETDIAEGKVPTSLKSDSIHLNASGYTAVGKLLANKIRSLGYV